MYYSVLQHITACNIALDFIVCSYTLQCVVVIYSMFRYMTMYCSMYQCIAMYYGVLKLITVIFSVKQCITVYVSV